MGQLPQSLRYEAHYNELRGCGFNEYSQFGEDGLIDRVFQLIGTDNEWCFEVGAADGVFYSNTLRLREQGWSAVLAESDPGQFDKLAAFSTEKVHCVYDTVTDLDEVLGYFATPMSLDFGVIDIDGQDYWLWHDLQLFRPRVMLVEFHWQDGMEFIPPRSATDKRQAGETALRNLATEKGYTVVATTLVNLLMVRTDQMWTAV